MIHFYYSETGEYNIENIADASESIVFDKNHNKVILFGTKDFYFQKTSAVYTSDAQDEHLSFSQTGAYNLYSYTSKSIASINSSLSYVDSSIRSAITTLQNTEDTKIAELSSFTHTKVSELNSSLSYVNTKLLSNINDLSTYTHNIDVALNASINTVNSDLYDKINDVSTYAHNNVIRLDSSIYETIQYIKETEEVWSYTYNYLDSSIHKLETRIAALESQLNS